MYTGKERLDLLRYCKLGESRGMLPPLPPKFFIYAISCVFLRTFSVNKYKGKENATISFLIYISSVIGKVQCKRKKGKTVTPSRRSQARGEMFTL